jgi:hypothetical protein
MQGAVTLDVKTEPILQRVNSSIRMTPSRCSIKRLNAD